MEDVFDFPGGEDEGIGPNPVPWEAHVALREAFKSVKRRYSESQAQITELQVKLKGARDRKGSHSRVYQERDELHNLLQKSYLAFKEKHGENEQLKKIINELKEKLRMSQEGVSKNEGGSRPGSASEEERNSEKTKCNTIIKELQVMGLEVIEEKGELFIILTERDHLRKWIEVKSDGNVIVTFKGTFEDKEIQTDGVLMKDEHRENENRRTRAEIIQLKKKIQDQAEELARFYKVFKEAMEQNLKYAKEKKVEAESKMQDKQSTGNKKERSTKQTSTAIAESMLASLKVQVADMKQTKHHVEKQNNGLHTLVSLTDKMTKDFKNLVASPEPREVSASPWENGSSQGAEGGVLSTSQGDRKGEENSDRVFTDDAPLSIAVQETEMDRVRNSRANVEFASGAMYDPRLIGRETVTSPSSPPRTVPMETSASDNTWTGESDIEVIEEEEDVVGAGLPRGKICPVCDRYFPESFNQHDFEIHVNQHFDNNA